MKLPSDKAHYETHLEGYIVSKLEAQGWLVGENKHYDPEYAVYPEDLFNWIKVSQPQKWDALVKSNGDKTQDRLLDRLGGELNKKGMINVFRKGFSMAGAGEISLTESAPEDSRNQESIRLYKANILRVVPQLKYNPTREFAIDLVFFINGLPMATVEIKTEFNQSLDDAINQYKNDRKPIDPKTKRKEPLLLPKRGAIVHFAVCENEIAMTTELDGENTQFLPFNKGNDGHAGNPPANTSSGEDYPIAYFYDYVLQPDNWLRIFHNFIYIEKKKKMELTGRWYEQERLIFPRYHQFDAVTKIINDVKKNGVGLNYLCEHSAGSGKTSTISWICHSLVGLRHDDGKPFYDSVIVITDRNVLDSQLQEAIKQLEHQQGMIENISRDDKGKKGISKSKQLESALISAKPIIVVTIQTFPYVMDAILSNATLSKRNYAVVIDEAHTSQTGKTASKLQATLSYETNDELTIEDFISSIQKNRVQSQNLSYFAFTATPKHSTLMLFGRTADGQEASDDNLPQSFHLYPQRQAIEEGFILDVLKGYVSYGTAFKLGNEALKDEKRVNKRQAKKTLAKWMSLHATNVTQKVKFIIEHFHHNVANMLNGQAKAMIVTSSRPAAVRYKLALEKFIHDNPDYKEYRVLVAFSDKVTGKQVKHADDKNAENGDIFNVNDDDEFTEASMNPDAPSDLRIAFDRPEYRLMVVANKFQTGFDQPKLCAMYIDKVIGNEIEVVQTLSRLNRKTTGKDRVFIIDFVNEPQHVLNSFKKYDSGAEIESIQDPNVVYTLRDNIDEVGLITDNDLELFKNARFKTIQDVSKSTVDENTHAELFKATDRIARLYNEKITMLKNAIETQEAAFNKAKDEGNKTGAEQADYERKQLDVELQTLSRFKSDLNKFSRVYSYVAQLIDFNDPDLEVLASFCSLLAKRLNGLNAKQIDVSGLVLTGFSIFKKKDLETGGTSPTGESGDAEKSGNQVLEGIKGNSNNELTPTQMIYLNEILDVLEKTFGDISTTTEQIILINHILTILNKDNNVVSQIQNNPKEVAIQGNLQGAVDKAIIQALSSHTALTKILLKMDENTRASMIELLYEHVKEGKLIDLETLTKLMDDEGDDDEND